MLRSLALAAVALAVSSGWAMAQDAAAGQKVFARCKSCHEVGPDAKAKVGPPLQGVVGRPAGSVEGFAYSDAMKAKAPEIGAWDEAKLSAYLTDPSAYLGGPSKMTLKLANEKDRQNVIAYLATQK
ncbi:cytochrome c family protein [Hansschlegelia sp.]|uniref:c-type cytochrome n=1 Tax=Hansschlegelia sp. TaxID=2041892 RepID=UPI002D038E84|nr:cytochrome c family protein [Hansschlegelia sp.]HVI29854.1 cytochrome c family protein [Hansschlegelia sp.]